MLVVTCGKCGTQNRVNLDLASARRTKCGKCGATLDVSERFANGQPLVITDESFEREILQKGSPPVLVDFWAPWCGPCRMIAPAVEQLAAESHGKYRVAKLDVDENPRTAAQFQIQSIPTLLIFKDGKVVDRLIGAQSKEAMASRLARV